MLKYAWYVALISIFIFFSVSCDKPNEVSTAQTQGALQHASYDIALDSQRLQSTMINTNSLRRFYGKLKKLESGQIKKLRIMQFGDSHTACDWLTGELRELFSLKFGSGGPGFVFSGKPWPWYYHSMVSVNNKRPWLHYRAQFAHNHQDTTFKTFCPAGYGLGGVCTVGQEKNSDFNITMKRGFFNSVELWYLSRAGGGDLELSFKKGKISRRISTDSSNSKISRSRISLKPQKHLRLRLIDNKGVSLFGLILENNQTGVVFDTLGLDGAKITHLLNRDWQKNFLTQIKWRQADLIILSYGSNSVKTANFNPLLYKRRFALLLRRIRAASANQCDILVLGPPDLNVQLNGNSNKSSVDSKDPTRLSWQTPPTLKKIIQAQINACQKESAAFISLYSLMGGENSMDRHVRYSPQLGQDDHIHLTKKGYELMARKIFAMIMSGYKKNLRY